MTIFSYLNDPATLMLYAAIKLLIIFTVMPVHEYAHAYAADKLGDHTARYSGRLTLNPLAHVDPLGALLIFLFGFGWAKPVPFNPVYFKHYRRDIALTAAAGPISNLICAAIGIFINKIIVWIPTATVSSAQILYYICMGINYFVMINISLAVFNLFPIHPLDGEKILSYFVPAKVNAFLYKNSRVVYIVFLVLILTGVLSGVIGFLSNLLRWLISLLFIWVDPLMRLILG